jgi:hypothetical protein
MTVVWIIIVVVVVAAIAYFNYWRNKKRREAFQAWAAKRGFSYTAEDNSVIGRFDGTPFGQGDHRRAKNVVIGKYNDRPALAFDYSYQTHSTDSEGHRTTETHDFGIIAIGLPCSVPTLQVTREGVFQKLGRAVGIHDIELENEDFNRKFKVASKDKKFAYDVLHPRMMQLLLDSNGPAWRIAQSDLMCWDQGKNSLEIVETQLGFLTSVADQVPRFVWQDHQS